MSLISTDCPLEDSHRIAAVRRLYQKAEVFETARRLVDKHQDRAEAVADSITPEPLRRLFYFLIDTVLQRNPSGETAAPAPQFVSFGLPITQAAESRD